MTNRRVFFGRLPHSMGEDELRRLCSEFGSVTSAHVAIDNETGHSRGFGFVEMGTVAAAREVVRELGGRVVGGRPLTLILGRDRGPETIECDTQELVAV